MPALHSAADDNPNVIGRDCGTSGSERPSSKPDVTRPDGGSPIGSPALPPLLTIQDLSRLFQRSERQLYRDIAAGRFPAPSIRLGKQKLWRIEAITAFIESGGKRTKSR